MESTKPIWRKRLIRWTGIFIACVVAGFLLFRPAMWLVGQALVVEQKPATVQFVWVVPEHDYRLEHHFSVAIKWYHENPQLKFLCVEQHPINLVREGVITPRHVWIQEHLEGQGIPAESIEVVSGGARNLLESGTLLCEWMADRADAELTVVCERFTSRAVRSRVNRAFGNRKGRVYVYGAANPAYDDDNWWKHRGAVKNWMVGATKLLFGWTRGGSESPHKPWDVQQYERRLTELTHAPAGTALGQQP
jgi:hypothetical protein